MPRRNRCTGELEHPNGCTASAYVVSSVLALVLVLGVPLAHVMFFVDNSPGPTDRCVRASGVDVETHAAAMALYYRYEVVDNVECTFETEILRGCVADDAAVLRFPRYPPGALRAINVRDVRDEAKRSIDAYVDAADADGIEGGDDVKCEKPAVSLAPTLTRVASEPYLTALSGVAPVFAAFAAAAADASSSASVSFVDYACVAAVDRAITLIDEAFAANGASAPPDLSARVAAFFAGLSEEERPQLCAIAVTDASPCEERDTDVGSLKGSDLGFGRCDFVEFADVA